MAQSPEPYNPLAESNLARQVADAIERQQLHPVPPPRFYGSGLYALYYHGPLDLYKGVSGSTVPVYVGKAAARSTRIGSVDSSSSKLWERIHKHGRSIEQAENLRREHFSCRYLVTSDVWVVLGEQGLHAEYGPLWNVTLDGFGNNDPGSGRYDQAVSSWDTLHPGRPWVEKLEHPNPRSISDLEQEVRSAIAERAAGEEVPDGILAADPLEGAEDESE